MTESMRSRGMRDMLPSEMERFRRIENAFRDVSLGWGYREIRTPTIEHLYLFTAAGTLSPQMLDGVYSFLDWDGWSGERVVLRPDSTIPAARLFAENLTGEAPARLFYVQNVFRFQPNDDTREDWQCGVELIGAEPPQGDVELIAMALETLSRLGIEASVKVSDPGILRAILEQAGVSQADQASLYDRVLAGDTSAVDELQPRLPGAPALKDTLGLEGEGAAYISNLRGLLAGSIPAISSPLGELASVCEMLDGIGVAPTVAPLLVRDFEYYTGPAFHLFAGETKVGGGGRYDALISQIGGKATPASGFALEFEPLLALIGDTAGDDAGISIRCEAGGDPASAFALAVALRRQNLAVEVGGAARGRHITVSGDGFSVSVNGGSPRKAATIDEAVAAVSGA
ncbi:MAG TPA: ATP phosphoribosyltransferase regulatory subunit [Dehalococcoidia bacterium]|nr:ATP phosphoribosyltransferase regulatory subunit [Dehalococcoidia bacterium]